MSLDPLTVSPLAQPHRSGPGNGNGSAATVTIGLDADDTLWHNEDHFQAVEVEFGTLLADFGDPAEVRAALFRTETANIARYGYGVKSYTLSMVETAIAISGGRVDAPRIAQIIDLGKSMLARPPELLPHVAATVTELAERHPLVLITKGDLHHQQGKVHDSGLAHLFGAVEVVAEKDTATYARILSRQGIEPRAFVMVGNSLKSDILPVVEIGGHGVHIPYAVTWAHEHAEHDGHERVHELTSIRELPQLLGRLTA